MKTKKKSRGRLEIATDIYNVFQKKLSKSKEKKLLKLLFEEMQKFEQKLFNEDEKLQKRAMKQPQVCSPYEIFHNRGCGKCKTCLSDSGERYYPDKPKFLNC